MYIIQFVIYKFIQTILVTLYNQGESSQNMTFLNSLTYAS